MCPIRKKYYLQKEGFRRLIDILKDSSSQDEPEEIQTKIYEIGMSLKFDNLKDWFSALYEILLGQTQGPRLGSFIILYGVKEVINLIDKAIEGKL